MPMSALDTAVVIWSHHMTNRLTVNQARLADKEVSGPLLDRFLRYVKFYTTADGSTPEEQKPSAERIFALARVLVDELKELGVTDVTLDDHAFVVGRIPATEGYENVPSIAFMSHMDTAEEVTGENVKPRVWENYQGGPIDVGNGVVLDPAKLPVLKDKCIGDTIITTDGTTLLGADDKCGVAAIMTLVDLVLNKRKVAHGPIEIIFNADEEIGRGTSFFPFDRVKSKIAYTVDGGEEGELECECFNAVNITVTFYGISVHPGYARGKLVNAVLMASSFVNMLPKTECPEVTDGYQGFYAPMSIEGGVEKASVFMLVRDFNLDAARKKVENVKTLAKAIEAMFPGGRVEVDAKEMYYNMRGKLDENPKVMDLLCESVKRAGVEPVYVPIRGGTDGAELTRMGVSTPNLFTGGINFHSRSEFACLSQMVAAVYSIYELVKLYAAEK